MKRGGTVGGRRESGRGKKKVCRCDTGQWEEVDETEGGREQANKQMVSRQGEERRKKQAGREREREMSRQGRHTASDSAQESVTESGLELHRRARWGGGARRKH